MGDPVNKTVLIFCMFFFLLGSVSLGYADWRSYVWTNEYQTMPKGAAEIEYSLIGDIPDTGRSGINSWVHQIELEYGITDHWDASLYQMFKYERTDSKTTTRYDGFKVETRYRFGQRGQYFVDPLIYFEYQRDPDLSKPSVAEVKLVLAKDIGALNISYNQIFERVLENRGKTESEYAVGLSYNVIPSLKIGIESKGSYSERENAVGPTLSWARGKIWVALGAVFGVNRRTDDLQVKMMTGFFF